MCLPSFRRYICAFPPVATAHSPDHRLQLTLYLNRVGQLMYSLSLGPGHDPVLAKFLKTGNPSAYAHKHGPVLLPPAPVDVQVDGKGCLLRLVEEQGQSEWMESDAANSGKLALMCSADHTFCVLCF